MASAITLLPEDSRNIEHLPEWTDNDVVPFYFPGRDALINPPCASSPSPTQTPRRPEPPSSDSETSDSEPPVSGFRSFLKKLSRTLARTVSSSGAYGGFGVYEEVWAGAFAEIAADVARAEEERRVREQEERRRREIRERERREREQREREQRTVRRAASAISLAAVISRQSSGSELWRRETERAAVFVPWI